MSSTPRVTAATTAGAQPAPGRRPRRLARVLTVMGAAAVLPAAGVLMSAGPAAAGVAPGHYITPTSVVAGPGDPMTFRAYTYSIDGRQIDETTATTFVLDGTPCNANVCSTDSTGSHTVTAEIPGWNPSATVQVLAPDHLAISPAATQVHAGDTVQYTVSRVTADGTVIDDVTAGTTISMDGVVCPGAACLATTMGQHTLTATDTSTVNGDVEVLAGHGTMSVLPGPPAHLNLTPGVNPVAPGAANAFHAEAFDAYWNDLGDVTSSTTFAIAPDGSCQANSCAAAAGGPHTVTGTDGQVTGTASITVLSSLSAGQVSTTGTGRRHVVSLPITLSAASSQPVTVYWHTKNGTATAGTDYVGVSNGKVTIPAGSKRGTIPVTILQNRAGRGSRQFTVIVTIADWATISHGTGTITITR
jgi:hypothetical protein